MTTRPIKSYNRHDIFRQSVEMTNTRTAYSTVEDIFMPEQRIYLYNSPCLEQIDSIARDLEA